MTNKSQKKARRLERRQNVIANRLAKKKANEAILESGDDEEDDLLEEEELDEGDDIQPVESDSIFEEGSPKSEEPEMAPTLKKDYGMGDMSMSEMVMPAMGPVSLDELDEQRQSEEQAGELRDLSCDLEMVVHNIMNNPMMDSAEKSAAVQEVGSGFQTRADAILAGQDPEDMQKDMDLLMIEALIAKDRRTLTAGERVADWITKAKLSYAAKKAQPDSSYALVVKRGKSMVRKYLIHDKAHVRNALARAAQQIKAGGQGAADAKAALPKIHAAAKRMGIGQMKKEYEPGIMIEKDVRGDWRWVGIPSNNFIDWHNDIISKEAHEEYVEFLDKNKDMAPVFMSWHIPGTERKNPVDYCTFENGFLIMSGKLEEREAAALLKMQARETIGMSFQGFGLRESSDPRVVTKYRMFEVSDLPLDKAANPFTNLEVISKEAEMDKLEYLTDLLGSKEKAEAYLQKTGLKQDALNAAGIESKEKDPKPAPEPKPVEQVKTVVNNAVTANPGDTQAIVEAVMKALDVEGLNDFVLKAKPALEKVEVLEGLVKDLQGHTEEKLADMIRPPAGKFAWMKEARASQDDSTQLAADDPLTKKTPGLGDNWLSEVTHTEPVEVESVR